MTISQYWSLSPWISKDDMMDRLMIAFLCCQAGLARKVVHDLS